MNIEEIKKLKTFDERYKYNIDEAVKTKEIKYKSGKVQKLRYLSWAYAHRIGKSIDENFSWKLLLNEKGSCIHDNTVIIEMNFEGKTEQLRYPFLDGRNQPISNPTGSDINDAQMRGMAKLFAMMSGIGLHLYTNEDIDKIGEETQATKTPRKTEKPKMTPEEEKEKKEKCIKWIVDNVSKIEESRQSEVLNNLDLLDLDNLELKELKIIYKNISKELEKGA